MKLKLIKPLAITGIAWSLLGFAHFFYLSEYWLFEDKRNAIATAAFMLVPALVSSILVLFLLRNKKEPVNQDTLEILKKVDMLYSLKQKGLLTDEEYYVKKMDLLKNYKESK